MHVRPRTRRLSRAALVSALAILALLSTGTAVASDWNDSYDWLAGDGSFAWLATASTSADGVYGEDDSLDGQRGLWVWPVGGGEYGNGRARWTFDAPGTTRIKSAAFAFSYRNRLLSHHCIELALRDGSASTAHSEMCKPPAAPASQDRVEVQLTDADATSTNATFGIVFPDCKAPSSPSCTKYIPQAPTAKDAARLMSVRMVLTDDDVPTVTASGPFRDLADKYIAGTDSYDVALHGEDAGSGVKRVALDRIDGARLVEADAPCDARHRTATLGNRICPSSFDATASIDSRQFPEGASDFRPSVTDLAAQGATGYQWRIFVDRTGPTAASNFQTDFDDSTNQADIAWQAGIDPALADGNAGSGLDHFEYRVRRQADSDWSGWVSTDESGFTLEDSAAGEQLSVEVHGIDAVGNAGEVAHADLVVMPGPECRDDGNPTPDAVGPELHGALPDGVEFDSVTFDSPVTQAELVASLPQEAKVLSLVERAPLGGSDVQTTGFTLAQDQDLEENLDFLNRFTYGDLDAARNSYTSLAANASTKMQASYQTLIDHLDTREAQLHTDGGPLIASVAVAHDPAVTSALVKSSPRMIASAAQATTGDGEECAATVATRSPLSVRGVQALASEGGSGHVERNVSPGTYRPPNVRIGTSTHEYRRNSNDEKVHRYYEVTATFSFGPSRNWSYWYDPERKTGTRGFELQVDMDKENNGQGQSGAFGVVPWMKLPPLDNSHNFYGVPGVWTANFRCAYPDDYFKDDIDGHYSLTVGSMCRPRASVQVFRWAHVLFPKDGNDRIGASVQPVHYARDDNPAGPLGFGSELDYCEVRARTRGSCMFGDIGVRPYTYPQTTVTPDIYIFKTK